MTAAKKPKARLPYFLDETELLDVIDRLSNLLPTERASDRFEEWLCVRYLETAQSRPSEDDQRLVLPKEVLVNIAACTDFADDFFGMHYNDAHRYFIVFKAKNQQRRWPMSRGGNKWPVQSFWQRFSERKGRGDHSDLFNSTPLEKGVSLGTKRGDDGIAAFKAAILWDRDIERYLNVLDLAAWTLRNESWPEPPTDAELVAQFLKKIRFEESEDVLFDPESQELLAQARALEH